MCYIHTVGINSKNIQKYKKETTNAFNDINELQKKITLCDRNQKQDYMLYDYIYRKGKSIGKESRIMVASSWS